MGKIVTKKSKIINPHKLQKQIIKRVLGRYCINSKIKISNDLEYIYSQRIKEYKRQAIYKGFENNKDPSLLITPCDVAGNILWHYPSHVCKLFRVLQEHELDYIKSIYIWDQSIFSQIKINFVDIGSGYGTFLSLIIDLLTSYQNIRKKERLPVYPFKLKYCPIEPSKTVHNESELLTKPLIKKAKPILIILDYSNWIQKEFPSSDCMEKIINVSDESPFYAIVMSNVLTWITKETFSETELDPIGDSLVRLINISKARRRHIVLLETKSEGYQRETFLIKLMATTLKRLVNLINPWLKIKYSGSAVSKILDYVKNKAHKLQIEKNLLHLEINILNPLESPWRSIKNILTAPIRFIYGHCIVTEIGGNLFKKALKSDTIKFAWAKARWEAMQNEIPGEAEYKLFEANIVEDGRFFSSNLGRLCTRFASSIFYSEQNIYEVPKPENKKRKKIYISFFERCLNHLFLLTIGSIIEKKFDKIKPEWGPKSRGKIGFKGVSWGNRLETRRRRSKTEWTFVYWFLSYLERFNKLKSYFDKSHKNRILVVLDIKQFYDEIPHDELLNFLFKYIPSTEPELRKLSEFIVKGGSLKNKGLPQGPASSSFLANLYLHHKLDEKTVNDRELIFYSRYVDDIAFIVSNRQSIDYIIKKIENYIDPLKLNYEKKQILTYKDVHREFQPDEELQNLSGDFRKVIQVLYRIPLNYHSIYQEAPDGFARLYSDMLRYTGIYINPVWIKRKLHRSRIDVLLTQWNPYFSKLNFPPIDSFIYGKEDIWSKQLIHKNPEWKENRDDISRRLIDKLKKAVNHFKQIKSGKNQKEERAARFIIYRLGVITNQEALANIAKFLQIDNISVTAISVLSNYENGYKILKDYIDSNPMPYLKARAIRALGISRPEKARRIAIENLKSRQDWVVKQECISILIKHGFGVIDKSDRDIIFNSFDPRNGNIDNFPLVFILSSLNDQFDNKELSKLAFERPSENENEMLRLASQFATYYSGANPLNLPEISPPYVEPRDYPDIPPQEDYYQMIGYI